MKKQIYVNLPVKNIEKTNTFFKNLWFEFEPNFSDEKATCMIIWENIYVMLLSETFFKTFTKKDICDTKKATEALICINAESRQKVDDLVKLAIENWATEWNTYDHDFMYSKSFDDLDWHTWEIMWMQENN